MTDTPEGLFDRLVQTQGPRPFVTYYDQASGERAELSVRSLGNWVAKTHFLLLDELGLGVGDRAAVALPAHWLAVPVVLGCWTAGLTVTRDGDADVAFVTPQEAGRFGAVRDVYAVNPEAAARGFAGSPPAGAQDYVAAVRPQPDAWPTVRMPAGPGDPALEQTTRADVLAAARRRADELGVPAGARMLAPAGEHWIEDVVLSLATGGSLVVVANGTDVETVAAQEKVTVRLPD